MHIVVFSFKMSNTLLHAQGLSRPFQDSLMLLHDPSLDVFLGDHQGKRDRKDYANYPMGMHGECDSDKKDRKTPTTAAPKRGEYRCGKCGFFPKKQKHTCAADKQKKGANISAAPKQVSAQAYGDPATMTLLPGAPLGYY